MLNINDKNNIKTAQFNQNLILSSCWSFNLVIQTH